MELGDLIRIFLKRWWIIPLAVGLTAGSAVYFGQQADPKYTATAEVAIKPSRADAGLTQSAKYLLRQFMTIADSDTMAGQVLDQLGYDMMPAELRSDVNFAAQDDRLVITIEVEQDDAHQAEAIARAWADQLKIWRDQENAPQRQEDRVNTELIDQPHAIQTWPPSWKILLAAGAVFGLVIAAGVILLLEFVESGIYQTPQELEKRLGLSVLGAIPRSK